MRDFYQNHKRLVETLVPILIGVFFMFLCIVRTGDSISSRELEAMNFLGYHNVLDFWENIFGYYDYTLQFFSTFCGMIAAVFIFQLTKKHFGIKRATIISALIILNPFTIIFGQIISPVLFFTMLIIILFIVLDILLFSKIIKKIGKITKNNAKELKTESKLTKNSSKVILAKYFAAFVVIVIYVFGIVKIETRPADNFIKDAIIDIMRYELSGKNNEIIPIVVKNDNIYTIANFYNTEKYPILDTPAENNKFWLLSSADSYLEDQKNLSEYHATDQIADERFVSVKMSK